MKALNHFVHGLTLFLLMLCFGCDNRQAAQQSTEQPDIFPNYHEVTIPPNIAPLNFEVKAAEHIQADFYTRNEFHFTVTGKNEIVIPINQWKELTAKAIGSHIEVCVSVWSEAQPDGIEYAPFHIHVVADSIDPWIAYRLIPPGYRQWKQMGLYQRCLESFEEKAMITNHHKEERCINCHSFHDFSPQNMMFHLRGPGGTTVLVRNNQPQRLDLEQLPPHMKGTYPHWHPNGRWIAFSNNNTAQAFYVHSQDKVEVYDLDSDLMICDTENSRVLTDERFTDSLYWETFPAFSPKGDYLYLCRAEKKVMPQYDSLHYALIRIPFDAENGQLGARIDTLYNPKTRGGSVSFPRISPDGQRLLYTETQCATFPIWHKEADFCMLNLHTEVEEDCSTLNSTDVESYHAWSSNSRWILFSSRRIDGRYTRLFIAHISEDGTIGKPFLLPQKFPKMNTLRLTSYNIPEFMLEEVSWTPQQIETLLQPSK